MEVQLTQAVVIFTGFQKGENEGSQVLETIKSLQGVPVTTADLLKTKAGLELKKLVKSENGEVKEAATQLQAYWVELIEAEKPQKRKREGQDSTPSKKVAAENTDSNEKKPTPKKVEPLKKSTETLKKSNENLKKSTETVKKVEPAKKEVAPTPSSSNFSENARVEGVIPTPLTKFEGTITDNPQRKMFQVKFFEALGPCNIPGGLETSALAIEIEEAMWKATKGDKKEFAAKFRTLFTNISDPENKELRSTLFDGTLEVLKLMTMSSEELANPNLQKERQELESWTTECRKPTKQEATCEMFKCSRCKQNKTTYYQLQTRSADEPMTTFVTCVNCGNHWKFC